MLLKRSTFDDHNTHAAYDGCDSLSYRRSLSCRSNSCAADNTPVVFGKMDGGEQRSRERLSNMLLSDTSLLQTAVRARRALAMTPC